MNRTQYRRQPYRTNKPRKVSKAQQHSDELLYGELLPICRLKKVLNAEILNYFNIKTFY